MSFRLKPLDKAYFVITIDDANKHLSEVYDICHKYKLPLCPAIIPWNLDCVFDNSNGRSVRDICRLIVEDGGEILSHSGKYLQKDSNEADFDEVYRKTREALTNEGFRIRGIVTAGGKDYLEDDPRLETWSKKYYEYSDRNGLKTDHQYWNPRFFYHDLASMDNVFKTIDKYTEEKRFTIFAMHGSDDKNDLEHRTHFEALAAHLASYPPEKAAVTTWEYVFDTFGSFE